MQLISTFMNNVKLNVFFEYTIIHFSYVYRPICYESYVYMYIVLNISYKLQIRLNKVNLLTPVNHVGVLFEPQF